MVKHNHTIRREIAEVLSKRNNLIFSEIIGKTLQAVEVNYLAQIYLILEGKFGD